MGGTATTVWNFGSVSGLVTNTDDALQRRSSLAWHGQSATLQQFGYDAASRLTNVLSGTWGAAHEYLASA